MTIAGQSTRATIELLLVAARAGDLPDDNTASHLADFDDTDLLCAIARDIRDVTYGDRITYSRKVFIPLTKLCRNSCHYCTFAHPPRRGEPAYLTPDQVLAIAEAGGRAGCHEALFTLGDKPELRYRAARDELRRLGYPSTLAYLAAMAALVLEKTGLLPHLNPGTLKREDLALLRPVCASMGLMLETTSERLSRRGGPHYGSPDKAPSARLATARAAGEARVPFTSGILVGIGETRRERIESLLALRALHREHGHIQEVIIQNFRAKPGTRMAKSAEPSFQEHLWSIAVARILLGGETSIQVPPNLSVGELTKVIAAGMDDWGGISPVTVDHVNPEAAWPRIADLAQDCAREGKVLVPRLAIGSRFARNPEYWLDTKLRGPVLRRSDAEGLARLDNWVAGAGLPPPPPSPPMVTKNAILGRICDAAQAGKELSEDAITRLFAARAGDLAVVCEAANALRRRTCGDVVSYVVTRNINYTNICYFRCKFCAFSKGKLSENLRGRPYDLAQEEIARRTREAWERGATEVCLQGGIHPEYTGETYLNILRTVKAAAPHMHVHAFSPLEVTQGAATLNISVERFLSALKSEGLGSLPGTAAEILDDDVRKIICPDKIDTRQWLEVMATAHRVGLRSTATIMFGHVDTPRHWARHILHLRRLQAETRGFTEFVPLPFVPMETPIYLKSAARPGPTWREALLMHAVARLALHPLIPNIQASWVKMGPDGVRRCLAAGCNDLGGTLMNETITRSAGAVHGQEMSPAALEEIILTENRIPRQRTTLYDDAPAERSETSFAAAPVSDAINTPALRFERA